jgi:hypothetical protein
MSFNRSIAVAHSSLMEEKIKKISSMVFLTEPVITVKKEMLVISVLKLKGKLSQLACYSMLPAITEAS